MSTDPIQPSPGRRPVYPVDAEGDGAPTGKERPATKPIPPAGSPDDPASDDKTESANHPNDE